MTLELVFPAIGTTLPTDHAYPLYAALSAIVPTFHEDTHVHRSVTPSGVEHCGHAATAAGVWRCIDQ